MQYSVLIPQRNAGEGLTQQIPRLCEVMESLDGDYEIVCLDDASAPPTVRILHSLMCDHDRLRVLRSERQSGVSALLAAGIAAARGQTLIATEAGNRYASEQILDLLSHLSRADLVFGQRRFSGLAKQWRRVARLPRWLLLGLEVRDPDCLFWAAQREAVEHLPLARGMHRYLSSLAVARGFRVTEIYVQEQPGIPPQDTRRSPGDLLLAWGLTRRMVWSEVKELHIERHVKPLLRIAATNGMDDAHQESMRESA